MSLSISVQLRGPPKKKRRRSSAQPSPTPSCYHVLYTILCHDANSNHLPSPKQPTSHQLANDSISPPSVGPDPANESQSADDARPKSGPPTASTRRRRSSGSRTGSRASCVVIGREEVGWTDGWMDGWMDGWPEPAGGSGGGGSG